MNAGDLIVHKRESVIVVVRAEDLRVTFEMPAPAESAITDVVNGIGILAATFWEVDLDEINIAFSTKRVPS